MVKWIKIDDRLPKKYQDVICANGEEVFYDMTFHIDDNGDCGFDDQYGGWIELDEVTHWMEKLKIPNEIEEI